MAQYFSLGGVSLVWTPDAISYGGGVHVTRHDLIGGYRTYDLMGLNPDDITITGMLAGATRYSDRDKILAMIGTQQPLVWGNDSRNVVILKAPFKQISSHLEYTITCSEIVAQSLINATVQASASNSVAQANAIAQTLPAAVTAPIASAAAILSNASADPSTALPSLAQAIAACNVITASGITAFDPTISGGNATVYSFTNGLTAWSASLGTVVAARQASASLNVASLTIQNGG